MLKTVEEIRRVRLRALLERAGSFASLNRSTGKTTTDATYSQISNAAPDSKTGKPREMGSALARSIEQKLSLPRGWMDNDPDLLQSAWPFATITPQKWLSYGPEVRAAWEAWILNQMESYDQPAHPKSTAARAANE